MTRKSISSDAQTEVLVKSRRRCCICYGLNRSTEMRAGQIAHLDRNAANDSVDNLAYLCLAHHDEYDSRTSQSKGLTIGEVKRFRQELHEAVGRAFAIQGHFGEVSVPAADPVAGEYVRLGDENDSAEITITPLPDDIEGLPRYHVAGLALHGRNREYGPNIGELDFVGQYEEGAIIHNALFQGEPYTVRLTFIADNTFRLEEAGYFGKYGMGVTFLGKYQRAS